MTRRHYKSFIQDSARWDALVLRDDDIVIDTPAKSGTTWMQMCCLVLIHGPELPQPLSRLAPWLDQVLAPLDELVARLEAQDHRRVIKSHTPLDGLPLDDRVTYIGVGRDPRDTILSMANHLANMDFEAAARLRVAAGVTEAPPPPDRPTDPAGLFAHAVADDSPVEAFTSSLRFLLHHLSTLWAHRGDPNVELFHYSDLRADLDGQMRRLATILEIDVDEGRWPALVDAARFESMKDRADVLAPNAESGLWHDNARFFAEGRLGSWRDIVPAEQLARYDERVAALTDPELAAWIHHGWLGTA